MIFQLKPSQTGGSEGLEMRLDQLVFILILRE